MTFLDLIVEMGKFNFPARRFGLAIAGALLALATIALIVFVHDPFGLGQARRQRLRSEAASAADLASLRGLEANGEAATTVRVEAAQKRIRAVEEATRILTQDARAADDAAIPIDAARLARLRSHDDELCRSAQLAGCPVEADHAAGGQPSLRALPPAGTGHAG